jgi:GNAT superfamily N-acetyltransferase
VIDPLVRPATLDDVAQLEALEHVARSGLVDARGGARWLETHPTRAGRWAEAIAAGDVHVAHIDEVVVGYLVAPRSHSIVRVDEVFVLAEARELGFGDALVAAAVDAGRRDGCALIEGEALPGDRDTKNLYERAGITARLITVSRRLV